LNWVACAVGASKHETVKRSLAALYDFSGPRDATILGRRERVDIFQAALLNGATSHTFDFDDTHMKTVIHPSGPVASAILALAEHQPVSGRDFLHAFILGVEAECRIGNSVFPSHYDAGWHITATAGVFGAAAAAGRLLKLNEQQMVWALGTAATQACGIRETFGTMAKPLHPGIAARNGLLAALLAKKNVTSAEQGIEGRRGFAAVLSTKFDPKAITEGLGKTWEISENTYKPYACGIVIHPAIEGCIQLRNEHKLKPEDIERIDLKVHPLVLELTGRKTPQAGLEGKFSIFHSCAAAILLGEGGEAAYSDAIVRNPRVISLRDRVNAVVQAGIHEDQVRMTMTLKDGRVFKTFVEHAVGSVARPMSDTDLEAKFRALVKGILPLAQADKLIGLCWNAGQLKNAAAIARAAVPARLPVKPRTTKRTR
ncbi:MAG: MmgE/PrpD family protein, partial [Burkholderiales bacterium]